MKLMGEMFFEKFHLLFRVYTGVRWKLYSEGLDRKFSHFYCPTDVLNLFSMFVMFFLQIGYVLNVCTRLRVYFSLFRYLCNVVGTLE